jgi:hypothetical protein
VSEHENNEERVFTQGDVDRVVQERLARDREQSRKREEEAVRAHADRAQELEAQLAQAQSELTAQTARAQQAAIMGEISRVAHERGIRDIDAAHKLLDPNLVTVHEDGTVDASVAVDALLESKSYLREPRSFGSADLGARGGGATRAVTRDEIATMSVPDYEIARRAGRLRHLGIG